jgi:hypothetical protein
VMGQASHLEGHKEIHYSVFLCIIFTCIYSHYIKFVRYSLKDLDCHNI